VNNGWGGSTFPMVPGHEIAGIVWQAGTKVTRYKVGDRVAVGNFVDSCRKCGPCHKGLKQYCVEGATWTYNAVERDGKTQTQGGYSNKIVVDDNYVLRIPDNLPLDGSAPLLCAGMTLYSPLMHWKAGPGKKVAIIGLEALGHIGVKIAHALGAEVTVLIHSLEKEEEEGKRMGADSFYSTSDPSNFKKLKGYFDLMINTVSIVLDSNKYMKMLALDGTIVLVGLPESAISIGAFSLTSAHASLAGSAIGGVRETQEMQDFCSRHNIACDIELIPIQKVNEAFERVVRSDVRYRFVIDIMNSLKCKD
jgi:alcohol dehydrogenase (NADP+)